MKFIILKKRFADETPMVEMTSAKDEFDFPFERESADLSEDELSDVKRDPLVKDVIASMPYRLVEPKEIDMTPADGDIAWGIKAIGAESCPYDGSGVAVAVLDTGIDKHHAAFTGIELGKDNLMDFIAKEEGHAGEASDTSLEKGHGTHCSGTIFGRDVDSRRIGVARGVSKVLIGKVLGPGGGSTESILNGIEWALKKKADVISMSLGMDFPGFVAREIASGLPADIATSQALEAFRSNVRLFDELSSFIYTLSKRGRGAILVAAAGNESRRNDNLKFTVAVSPPALADGFISVGALAMTNGSGTISVAPFSNTGCTLSAPGVGIASSRIGGGISMMSGTSMAAPHVAGVAALWTQSLFPDGYRPPGWVDDVLTKMKSSVREVPGLSRKDGGLGMVRAPR